MLYEYIKENFNEGEPMLLQDIDLDIKYDNLCQQTKKLVDDGKLCRFMDGVYYLPKKSLSGIPYSPSSDMVAELKYIGNRNECYGCYAGNTLANIVGLTEQMPMVKEILSNRTSAIVRKVSVGKFIYVIRKPAVRITRENVYAVMLLELLKDIDKLCDVHIDASSCLKNFIIGHVISKSLVDTLLPDYPLRTYKAIYDMGVESVLA